MRFLLRSTTLALLLAGATPAAAGELTHAATSSDSLESLGRAYYGAAWKAVYIAARNGLDLGDAVAGRKLVIPTSWVHRIRRGETLAGIAKRWLGDANRFEALARFNGLKDSTNLEVGQELLMPFHLVHVVQPGEGLSQISRRYYRTTRYSSLIGDYNGTDERLEIGQRLTIPIFDRSTLTARERFRQASATAPRRPAPAAKPPPRRERSASTASTRPPAAAARTTSVAKLAEARAKLRDATAAYRRGRFDEACPALEELLEALELEGPDRATLVKHLGFCAVAYDDKNAARDYFRNWVELDPKASLNPITTSPKILEVFYQVTSAGQLAGQDAAGTE